MTSIQYNSTAIASSTMSVSPLKSTQADVVSSPSSAQAKKSVVVTLSTKALALAAKPIPVTVSKAAETFAGQGELANSVKTTIAVTFSTIIKAGTGNITITDASGKTNATISITDTNQVTISGNTLTIKPSATQAYNSSYKISIASGAIVDAANASNVSAGTGKTPISFTTMAATSLTTKTSTTFSTTPVLSGTAAANSTVTISDAFGGNTSTYTATADSKGVWTYTPKTSLAAGDHVITASAVDAKNPNNSSGSSKQITLTVASVPTDQSWSWIGQLSDSQLITSFNSFAKSKTVSEADLSSAISDFSKNLGKTLTKSQVADLTLINSNLSKIGASSYVQFITNAFLNGTDSKGHDYWTGGTGKTVDLGKVTEKTTSANFINLYNKWFVGTDYPLSGSVKGSSVKITGYTAAQNPLFSLATSAPSVNDINQGQIGDCYFEASMCVVAKQNPDIIKNMFIDNQNGTYGVQFYSGGKPVYITIDNKLPVTTFGGFNSAPSASWSNLLEKAYSQLQAFGDMTGNGKYSPGSSYATIGNGGYGVFALAEITGASEVDDVLLGSQQNLTYSASQLVPGATSRTTVNSITSDQVWSEITTAFSLSNDVLISSRTEQSVAGKKTLIADHQFVVTGIDDANKKLTVRNPWGVGVNQNYNTTFDVKFSDLIAYKDEIIIDNVNGAFKSAPPVNPQLKNFGSLPTKLTA